MITPLKKTALHDLLNKSILFDANIFMVGISDRVSDKNCLFENMKKMYIEPLFKSFTDIYISTKKCIRNWMMSPGLLWIHILVKMLR